MDTQTRVTSFRCFGWYTLTLAVLAACAPTMPPKDPRAPSGIDLTHEIAATRGLQPYGVADSVAVGAVATPNIDAYLKPEAILAKQSKEATKPLAEAKVHAQPTTEPATVAPPQVATAEPIAANIDVTRYSERDQQATAQKQFRGGDTIVVTGGAILLTLLILLIVLIVT